MVYKKWANPRVRKLNLCDIQLIKLSAFCFGLVIGAYLAVWLVPYWWLLILVAVLAAIKPIHKALGK